MIAITSFMDAPFISLGLSNDKEDSNAVPVSRRPANGMILFRKYDI